MTIRRLDPEVASKIAAGEVVERPASCVKELVENSIDSGAKRIAVFVEGGGLELIKVTDDGSGIGRDDLPLALERYATSKLGDIADLENVRTLGFRGEALPSIAAVSELTITTRRREGVTGSLLEARGGRITSVGDRGGPPGTTVTVNRLFFNVPARLKFMKSRAREMELISETVTRLALAWPEIAFSLFSGRRRILETDGYGLQSALTNLFGPETCENLIPLECSRGEIAVTGFVGKPALVRRNRSCQFLSVRRRPVRSPLFFYALDQAYSGLLGEGEYPFAVLDITLPPGCVDVNVHPQKTEVRFKDETLVKECLLEAVTSALRSAGVLETGRPETLAQRWVPTGEHEVAPSPAQEPGEPLSGKKAFRIRELFGEADDSWAARLPEGYEYLGRVWDTFIVFSSPECLVVLDQHAFAEAMAYLELAREEHGSQLLLNPVTVTLDPGKIPVYEEVEPLLEQVGFSARLVGERSVLVTGVPVILGKPMDPGDIRAVLEGCRGRDLASVRASLAACHSSVRAGDELSSAEACELIRAFIAHPDVRTCPHGRPVAYRVTRNDVMKFFGRER